MGNGWQSGWLRIAGWEHCRAPSCVLGVPGALPHTFRNAYYESVRVSPLRTNELTAKRNPAVSR